MQVLTDFHQTESISLQGELQILTKEIVKINFFWKDVDNEIIFPKSPEGGRHFNLWQQTCFEAFIKTTASEYFEINLSTKGAWNVYRFDNYRTPQPPQEYPGAELLDYSLTSESIEARFLIKNADFKNTSAGLTAVLLLTNGRTTFWSTKHNAVKPDFHLFENFNLERKAP